jgi:hypothetical protein
MFQSRQIDVPDFVGFKVSSFASNRAAFHDSSLFTTNGWENWSKCARLRGQKEVLMQGKLSVIWRREARSILWGSSCIMMYLRSTRAGRAERASGCPRRHLELPTRWHKSRLCVRSCVMWLAPFKHDNRRARTISAQTLVGWKHLTTELDFGTVVCAFRSLVRMALIDLTCELIKAPHRWRK